MSAPVVEARIRIAANPDDVYHALTDEAALRAWFAEDAVVDIERGLYKFWGRYTFGAPSRSNAKMGLHEAVPGESLVYSWLLDGAETTVAIKITPDDSATQLHLMHRHVKEPTTYLIEAFWSMALENLRAYIERGKAGLRFDYSNIPHGDVALTTEIDAEPSTVFEALIDPTQLDRYMSHKPAHIQPHVGGAFDVGWGDEGPVKILDLVPGERLSYSWKPRDDSVGDTIVTWELEGAGGRTRLTLFHSGFAPDREGMDFGLGWLDYINRIKQMVETGDAWRKPSIHIVDVRDIGDAGLYAPDAGVDEAISSKRTPVSTQRGS